MCSKGPELMVSHAGWSCEVFWCAREGYFTELKGFQVLGKWICT
jgi:hypothetical protein